MWHLATQHQSLIIPSDALTTIPHCVQASQLSASLISNVMNRRGQGQRLQLSEM